MINITKSIGRLLILVGVIGFFVGMANGNTSYTALIPSFFGLVLILLAYVGQVKDNLRKHVMHVAVLISLLGAIAIGGRLISKISEIAFTPAYIAQIVTLLLFVFYIVLAVRSFINARKEAA